MNKYFKFDKEEERYLEEANETYSNIMSKFATKNEDALRKKKMKINYGIIRPPFSYDTDIILHSALYNRYTDKTQVFSFYKNDDLTRRALHVQLVAKIGKTIGRALRLNLDLIEAIALGHDMGHTPFGHKGEVYLNEVYCKETSQLNGKKKHFNHNVHSVRIFNNILNSNLTLQTLSGILAHNGEKVSKCYTPSKIEDFNEFEIILDQCYEEKDYHKILRPNTLEGCVVRISDMIAYAGKDRQDCYKVKLIDSKQFEEERLIGTKNRDIISNLIANIIKNSIEKPYLEMDDEVFNDLKNLISENNNVIYQSEEVDKPYEEIIKPLMRKLYEKLLWDVTHKEYNSPIFMHYLNDSVQGNYYRHEETRHIIADPNDIVTDFIASMTDDYFIDICKYLEIDKKLLEKIKYKEYFDL